MAAAVVAEARSWLGTPVKHLGRVKGHGVDCLGLVELVGLAAGVLRPAGWLEAYGGYYGRLPNPERLLAGLERFLAPISREDQRPGDIGLFSWGARELGMHLAIFAEHGGRGTMIHADPRAFPRPRVVEHGFTADWPDRCLRSFRYPGLAAATAAGGDARGFSAPNEGGGGDSAGTAERVGAS